MPTKKVITDPDACKDPQGPFRRAEDWERLTRLEFLVQELSRENERVDFRIDKIVEKQEHLQQTQDKMMRVALNIRFLLIGGLVTAGIFVTGLSKIFPIIINTLITGI